MRGPSAWSVAVRKPDGEIAEVNRPILVPAQARWARLPVVRGVFALGESLAIEVPRPRDLRELRGAGGGVRTGRFRPSSRADSSPSPSASRSASSALQGLAGALITSWLPIESTGWFVVVEGLVRVIFVLYLVVVGLLPTCGACSSTTRPSTGDQHLRGGRPARAGGRPAPQPHPRPLRHRLPPVRDGDRHLRVRLRGPAGLVLADRLADPAPAS